MRRFFLGSLLKAIGLFIGVSTIFAPAVKGELPTVVTLEATTGGGTTATLNATVNPGDDITAVYFEYGTDTNFSFSGTIYNPSFESNTFSVFPGYAGGNGGVIDGWTFTFNSEVGLNPAGESPFANNGAIPDGVNVAFIQANGVTNTLSTTISNLVPGKRYQVTFRANSRDGYQLPEPEWSLNGGGFVPFDAVPPVGGTNAYYTNSATFVATNDTAAMVLRNSGAGDPTVLLDAFSIVAVPYGHFSATNILAATNTTLVISNLISGLSPDTQYHFRVIAANSAGESVGENRMFRTARIAPMTVTISNAENDGPGSLRQAILDSVSGDTILFDPSLSGASILLTNGALIVTNSVTIDASTLPGGLRINGNSNNRIFQIDSNATVTLTSLTLTNGGGVASGGAIFNSGNLTLNRCTLAGNSVIGAKGTDTPAFGGIGGTGGTGAGGAIFNAGVLTVNQCTLVGNLAKGGTGGKGGGSIGKGGTGGTGGAGNGGAIYNSESGDLTVNQSTFAGNSVNGGNGGQGGGGNPNGNTGLGGSASGGGIYQLNQLTLFNSIVAANSPNNIVGAITSIGNNLTNGNPLLSSLGNNGGPTPTMVLLFGSPALDAGAATAETTDQRGCPRVMGTAPDLGSVEMTLPTVSTLPASNIATATATLNGAVNPNGVTTSVYFQYGTTTNYGSFTSTNSVGDTNAIVNVANVATNLLPATTYHFRIVTFNDVGMAFGAAMSFTTSVAPPVVATFPATGISSSNAVVNCTVNPNGLPTSVYFEYGTGTNYGSASTTNTLGATNIILTAANELSNLMPGTLYYFRAVAANSSGISRGADRTFTTMPLNPVATTLSASAVSATNATLNGLVNPGYGATTAYFIYTTDTNAIVVLEPVISNPSFELDRYTNGHGGADLNGGGISGWAISPANRIGLNPADGSPFADNGKTPDGTNVVYLQSVSGGTSSLSTSISNLTVGRTYSVRFRANSRVGYAPPSTTWSLNGGTFISFTCSPPVGGFNPYYTNSATFTATNNTAQLVLRNSTQSDSAVLLDAFTIVASSHEISTKTNLAGTNTDVPVSTQITGLQPGTRYYFYIVANNGAGTAVGSALTFLTDSAAPIVTSSVATDVTATNATLNGSINSRGAETLAYFEYGTNSNFGSFSDSTDVAATNITVAVSNLVSNLLPNTFYYFRLVGTNVHGRVTGSIQVFQTGPAAPVVTPFAAVVLGTNSVNGFRSVRLTAAIKPNGANTTGYFQYGLTDSYGANDGFQTVFYNVSVSDVSVVISLSAGHSFHWRVVAQNSLGSTTSPDQTFNLGTLALPPGLAGDLNGDGVVSQEELNAVYGNYFTNSPWLYMTNVAGLGNTNVTFQLDNTISAPYHVEYSTNLVDWLPLGPATPQYLFNDTNAAGLPHRYYRLIYP